MRHKMQILYRYLPWLSALLAVDGLSVLLLWLADAKAFRALSAVVLLASLFLFGAVVWILIVRERKQMQAFEAFLLAPDEYHQEKLIKTLGVSRADGVLMLGTALKERQSACSKAEEALKDYEEYVESWAHEIKAPLFLLTLLLDNRRDEISGPVSFKIDYVRSRIQEFVNQMLYYARLKGTQKDYLFEWVSLLSCIEEVLGDYRPLLKEKKFRIDQQVPACRVYTDKRGLRFILAQAISNAVKYSGKNPRLSISWAEGKENSLLSIRDNGIGVKACDLPYIFEKGFTGDTKGGRKKATGMGLYLAKKMADDLKLTVEAGSEWGCGFELTLTFPKVAEQGNRES
ncbi:Sensor histidine kinase graS [uncultured Roseburia sp.]|uniref:histidine kinase n=1 Tax=Brotonthovivens ammoniilytica TaxID=2981725 RepID=A0ABT2TND9_9FIRM|nr:sensor histidine kinase [Brotonthovivens ammoniilytica]MCU6763201.1 sensor histidine kinase [Brotonthovivens ammoniilytica]SCJ06571.1 Sensor histidine kinase graS [uncultured Roseburia sp.]